MTEPIENPLAFPALKVTRKTGDERFSLSGDAPGLQPSDFWKWSASDGFARRDGNSLALEIRDFRRDDCFRRFDEHIFCSVIGDGTPRGGARANSARHRLAGNGSDFDGDQRADLNVFRPSNGTWYRINSINNGLVATQFGTNGDLPVPADFDGDGRADVNVFRPSNGTWYRINSSPGCVIIASTANQDSINNSANPGCFVATQFGLSSDRPAVGDFNGDGRADISVFRPSNGTWYYRLTSATRFSAVQFGMNGDLAIPAAFVP